MAAPFVQGQLLNRNLSARVDTSCAHCDLPLHLEINSDLNVEVLEDGAKPLLTAPLINLVKLKEPSIIDAF